MNEYCCHCIVIDERGRVVDGFSDAFRAAGENAILINDKGEYQFRLFPGGAENPSLYDWEHAVPLYKYEDGKVVKRTAEEMAADIAALPAPKPTTEERVETLEEALAQTDETAIELYEAQAEQEAINAAQDEALIEIYELMEV